jgi:hypothetical protein
VPLSEDTPLSAERIQLELLRQATPQRRFALMQSLSSTLITASRKELQKRFPNETEARLEWVRLHYGEVLASGLRKELIARNML